jgi:hypothetical protein
MKLKIQLDGSAAPFQIVVPEGVKGGMTIRVQVGDCV